MCSPLKASDLTRQISKSKGKSLIEMGLGEGIELDALGLVPGPTSVCRPYFAN